MAKKILIIGGGIAGLTAGCYARMNGFDTEIFEMHSTAGGLCTAWKRKEYVFDGCLHWLVGSDPSSVYYSLWEELGAVQGKTMVTYPYFSVVTDAEGNRFTIWSDPEKLREEMLRLAPEDRKMINRIIHDIKILMKNEIPPEFSIRYLFPMIRYMRFIMKYRDPIDTLAGKFQNTTFRNLFIRGFEWGPMCSVFVLSTLAYMGSNKAAYLVGGSLPFIQSILERYQNLGGLIWFNSKITGITVENDRTTGITLANGDTRQGDYIISAADGHTTIYDWLGGKYIGKDIAEAYKEFILFPHLIYVSLGLNFDYSKEPHNQNKILKQPHMIGGEEISNLFIRTSAMDPTLAPKGKSVMTLMIPANYEYWKKIPYHGEDYKIEKERCSETILKILEEYYPAIRQQVEEINIATPHTYIRYTGNWRGSYEGWFMDRNALKHRNLMTLPGLDNFYMAGHWTSPGGGLPAGLITGRIAIKKICKKERVRFKASKP